MSSFVANQRQLKASKLSITELLDEKDSAPLYAINTSDINGLQPRGDVYITVRNGDRDQMIKLYNTWIPIDLTAFAPRQTILNSPDFRQAMQRGRIQLVSNSVANDVLQSGEAADEERVLRIRENYSDPDAQAQQIQAAGLNNTVQAQNANRQLARGENLLVGVQPQVVGMMERESMTDRDVVTSLRTIASTLTERDLHYIMSRIDSSAMPRVAEFARSGLAELADPTAG
jgi:hypothetical protein